MMDDNDDVKAGRGFQSNKDIGVKAQMEGVKWLLAASTPPTPSSCPLCKMINKRTHGSKEMNAPLWFQQCFLQLLSFTLLIFPQFRLFLYIILILSHPSAGH